MKLSTVFGATALVLAVPVFAQDSEEREARESGNSRHCSMMQDGMMNMMNEEQKTAMQEHMQGMKTTMEEIRQEENPERRAELMQVHMESMQHGMDMMQKMMDGMMRDDN
ncbi:hypothetical protein PHACT_04575 [Pseudohongiella acticola]|uniref:DUF4175 domain-containing protein n=1 Tax=Pseudohongiella acticola TaxID=1524254 RepID=A0A1E8CJR0_9GAMM|nr:hypothetical protein [Pseudohongiella acticola]OFE12497.1 hypothetical protein PHACT_04575 [Pseudohongiella acticola]